MPKSVPRLVLDKVRQVLVSVVLNSNVLVQKVPNKSLSQELMFYFVVVVVKMNRCSFVIECFTPVLSVLCLIAKETE